MMNDTRGNNKCSTTTATTTNTIHLGQPTPAFTNLNTNTKKKLAFTRLDDLQRRESSMEEIPFDERPKHLVTASGSIYHSPLSTRNFDSGDGIMNKNQSMSNGNTTRLSSLDEIMTLNSNVGRSISSVDSGLIAVVPSSTAAEEEEPTEGNSDAAVVDVVDDDYDYVN